LISQKAWAHGADRPNANLAWHAEAECVCRHDGNDVVVECLTKPTGDLSESSVSRWRDLELALPTPPPRCLHNIKPCRVNDLFGNTTAKLHAVERVWDIDEGDALTRSYFGILVVQRIRFWRLIPRGSEEHDSRSFCCDFTREACHLVCDFRYVGTLLEVRPTSANNKPREPTSILRARIHQPCISTRARLHGGN
jgi:hypothetical protein